MTTLAYDKDDYPYLVNMRNVNVDAIKKAVDAFRPVVYTEEDIATNIPIKIRSALEKFEETYLVIYDNWRDTEYINGITDLFSERVRVRCNFKHYPSPLSYWNKNKQTILKRINKSKIHDLREYIYSNTKLCNNFRISVSLAILNIFKPKKWLDISAGWGDRLLSAILYGVEKYVAADPNLDLHPCYDNIIKTFAPTRQSDFIVHPMGFENAPLHDTKFDLVFSSPPFFDLEQYSTHPGDSLQYTTEIAWCLQFLWPSLLKAYRHLKRNGHMVLYISGSPTVMSYLTQLNAIMKYKGVIYFIDSRPRAMYVWQKTISKAL
jgi:hypothetical protein